MECLGLRNPPFRDETTEGWGIHYLCGVWSGLAEPVEVISSMGPGTYHLIEAGAVCRASPCNFQETSPMTIFIPTPLRPYAGGQPQVEIQAPDDNCRGS